MAFCFTSLASNSATAPQVLIVFSAISVFPECHDLQVCWTIVLPSITGHHFRERIT